VWCCVILDDGSNVRRSEERSRNFESLPGKNGRHRPHGTEAGTTGCLCGIPSQRR
jgi:hypothetical protein